MKKLTLLTFMVLFSLTVFSSNNEPTKKETTEKKLVLIQESSNGKVFISDEKESCQVNVNDDEIILSEPATADVEVSKANSLQDSDSESKSSGMYIYDLIVVDNIKYIPDLRPWFT